MRKVFIKLCVLYYRISEAIRDLHNLMCSVGRRYYLFSGASGLQLSARAMLKYPENISFGENCIVGKCVIGARSKVTIGNNVTISEGAVIETAYLSRRGEGRHSSREIVIEDNVWICANAMVLAGARVASGVTVPANSVIKGGNSEVEQRS